MTPPGDAVVQPTDEKRFAWLPHWASSPAVRCLLLALVAAALLTKLGTSISRDYYRQAYFHFDPAGYRYLSLIYYQQVKQTGRFAVASQLMHQKDSLDDIIRVLVWPQSLTYFHGHLLVEVPFMILFFFLALWYSYKQTHSYVYGIAALASVSLFTVVYHPTYGLIDNLKDNLAIWMLGGALLSWFLSEGGSKRWWAFLSGVLWSLLATQRVVLVVYGVALISPFFVVAIIQRIRSGAWGQLLRDGVAFGAVPLAVATMLIVTQAQHIYQYYFVIGYGYASPAMIAQWLWVHPFTSERTFRIALALVLAAPILVLALQPRRHAADLIAGLWLLVAFPVLVIATHALYMAYCAVLMVLVVIAICRLAPRTLSPTALRWLSVAMVCVAICGGFAQSRHNAVGTQAYISQNAPHRLTYSEIGEILAANPPETKIGVFFDECLAPIRVQMKFQRGIALPARENAVFMSIHATYYKGVFGDKPTEEITQLLIAELEQPGALAFINADPEDLANRLFRAHERNYVPLVINTSITRHVLASDRWRVVRRIESPIYGPLVVCQYADQPLSPPAKWVVKGPSRAIAEIQLATAIGSSVRQFTYSAPPGCSAELFAGIPCQWIPAGPHGLRFTLHSERAVTVLFRSEVAPGPARDNSQRTMIFRQAEREQRISIRGEQSISVPLQLREGMNSVEILSGDEPNVAPLRPPADSRLLMFRLDSPHLLSDVRDAATTSQPLPSRDD